MFECSYSVSLIFQREFRIGSKVWPFFFFMSFDIGVAYMSEMLKFYFPIVLLYKGTVKKKSPH